MNVAEYKLATVFCRNWWVLLLRGLIAILFGVLAWLSPGISLAALVLLFGAYTLADGLLGVWAAMTGHKEQEDWWVLLLWGFIGIGVGILTFAAPGVTAIALLFYIAVWAIGTGVLEIMAAIRLRKEISGEWALIVGGLASVAFGVILMSRPVAGALTVVWLIGSYAVIFGILLSMLSLKVRAFGHRLAGP